MMLALFVLLCAWSAAAGQSLIAGPIEVVAEGLAFTEGPVWLPSGDLVFSDTRTDTIHRADGTVYRKPSGGANGLAIDPQGRLVICQQATRNLTRIEKDGSLTVLAERYRGKRLNAPNDVTVRSDGTYFFTDPLGRGPEVETELAFSGVYALTPDGTLTLLTKHLKYPNGIALSLDEKTLYVADTMGAQVRAYGLEGTVIGKGRTFCKANIPDGMAVDRSGNLWVAVSAGLAVASSTGELLATIKFPQWPANCTFGGADGTTLYVTARTKVFKVSVKIPGIRSGDSPPG